MVGITGPYFCFSFSGHCNGSNAAGYNVEFDVAQLCQQGYGCGYNENWPVQPALAAFGLGPGDI